MDPYNYNPYFFPPALPHFGPTPATQYPIAQPPIPQGYGFAPDFSQASHTPQPPHPSWNNVPAIPIRPFPSYNMPHVPARPPPSQEMAYIPAQPQPNPLVGWGKAIADVVALRRGNVSEQLQHTSGPIRTTKSRRKHVLQQASESVNAEAGPSTLPESIPSVDHPKTPPSGESSDAAADAALTQTSAKENKAPKPKRPRAPRGTGQVRGYRVRMKRDIAIIKAWVNKKGDLDHYPNLSEALSGAIEAIKTIRRVANEEHLLFLTGGCEGEGASGRAEEERDRRNEHRELYKELSRYYPRASGSWTQSTLLSEVVHDIENHVALQQSQEVPMPGTSLSTEAGPRSQ